jgi:hypothetical protein
VLPSEVPTTAPTDFPTTSPTVRPSNTPTEAPTDMPTAVPTFAPTDKPTVDPTMMPTVPAPTPVPTAAPTAGPSISLSPTFKPSAQTSPIVTFKSTIYLSEVQGSFDAYDCAGVTALTAAMEMDLPADAVTFVGTKDVTRIHAGNKYGHKNHHNDNSKTHDAEGAAEEFYSLEVVLRTSVAVDYTGYASSQALYDAVVSKLTSSIAGGEFTDVLEGNAYQYSAPPLYAARAGQVTNTAPTITIVAPSSTGGGEDDNDNDGVVGTATKHKFGAGAAVATVFLILFCIAVAGYYYQYHYLPGQAEAAEKAQKEAELNRRYSDAGGGEEEADYEEGAQHWRSSDKVFVKRFQL